MDYVKFDRVSLKTHPTLNERWVQDRIAEDPALLGLGDVILKDKERIQPSAGRLDLLLQHSEENRRFEVELQLGSTDESHIIRTLEYWDIERKRYPQYEHTAVLIAEDITSRFLNVIALFNGAIPLIALQMQALKSGDQVGLVFTKVLDQLVLGLIDEDEDLHESADRAYWEQRGSTKTLAVADELFVLAKNLDPGLELAYKKHYIGLAKDGAPRNFVIFRPQKNSLRFEPRLPESSETQQQIEAAGLEVMDYDTRWGRYRIRLTSEEFKTHREILERVMADAYREARK